MKAPAEKWQEIMDLIHRTPALSNESLHRYAQMFFFALTDKTISSSQIVFESLQKEMAVQQDPSESEENLKECWSCEQDLYHAIKTG